jgi:hypothetical protein
MLSKDFTDHLRAAHRALWRQDTSYRMAVLAAPVIVAFAAFHALPGGKNAHPVSAGPPAPVSIVNPFPNADAPPSAAQKPSAPAPVLKIAPNSALPANTAPASGYQSPFSQ